MQTPWEEGYRNRVWSTLSSTSRFLGRIISDSRGIRRKESGAGSYCQTAASSADTGRGRPCATGRRPWRRPPAGRGDTGPGSRCRRSGLRRPAPGSHRIRPRTMARRCGVLPRVPRRRGVPHGGRSGRVLYAGLHFPEGSLQPLRILPGERAVLGHVVA